MSKTIRKTPPKTAKKSSFSDREYVNLQPNDDDIAQKDGGRYLPIDVVERDLDRWAWGTQNFTWQRLADRNGNSWIGASLELVIPWVDEEGKTIERRLVGACNFAITAYAPNKHFVATAKSECVKNAALDLGSKFGRGLNEGIAPEGGQEPIPAPTTKPKRKPDKDIRERFDKAMAENDEATIALYSNIYEFKTEENGNETL